MQDLFDILYTPLDCPPMPKIDVDKLDLWQQDRVNNFDKNKSASAAELQSNARTWFMKKSFFQGDQNQYPWDLSMLYYNKNNSNVGWLGGFDKEFPELVEYINSAFGIPVHEFGTVLLLPVKKSHTGIYWHRDDDTSGLRMYIEHEDPVNNTLIMRRSVTRDRWPLPWQYDITRPLNGFQEEDLTCNIVSKNQCFFLNNIRALHATVTKAPERRRFTLLFGDKLNRVMPNRINQLTEDLIKRSAEKYKEQAILWPV